MTDQIDQGDEARYALEVASGRTRTDAIQAHALRGVGHAILDLAAAYRERTELMKPAEYVVGHELEIRDVPFDGVLDPMSPTGWAAGKSPRSVFGDDH